MHSYSGTLALLLATLPSTAPTAIKATTELYPQRRTVYQGTRSFAPDVLVSRGDSKPFPLRILPLGASITYGTGSSDGNGYREHLRDLLQLAGFTVNMVGTVRSGRMEDSENEGHPGAVVHQVAVHAEQDVHFQPNLVLINAGTNDVLGNSPQDPLDTIDERMDDLLDRLFDRVRSATIVLSTLLPNANAVGDRCIEDIVNPKYRAIVQARRSKGQRIVLADMYTGIRKDRLGPDGTHPGDRGYWDMAFVWFLAVAEAAGDGMLSLPGVCEGCLDEPSMATRTTHQPRERPHKQLH